MLLLALLPLSLANGQTVHIWITREALEELPEGDLKDFLSREDLEPMLIHGTMFPDGGYPLGHPYAEAAHWEPFQSLYLDWIVENYQPPWTDEAAQHIAFLMGMASHGMADQTHDAWYLDWSANYYDKDAGWAAGESLDEATDFVWGYDVSPSTFPPRWIPDTLFVDLYAQMGIEVDTATLSKGQGLLETAVGLVGAASKAPDLAERYRAQFPWGCNHLEDTSLPGIPAFEAKQVADYWQDIWARLDQNAGPQHMNGSWPDKGEYKPTLDHTQPDARVSLIFARGLIRDTVTPDRFQITDSTGKTYPFDINVYYGNDSHIIHLIPTEDWTPDEDYTITAFAGLPGRDGTELAEDATVHFTTREPAEAEPQPGECGCQSQSQLSPLALLPLLGLAHHRKRPSQTA